MLAAVIFTALLTSALAACPKGAVQSSDSTKCYHFVPKISDFTEADEMCTLFGGHLASIKSSGENFVVKEVALHKFRDEKVQKFWIGANKLQDYSTWQWIDGRPYSYENWASINHDIFDANCAAMIKANGTWTESKCCEQLPYVCETPAICPEVETTTIPAAITTQPSRECGSGWFEFENWCYRVYPQGLSWQEAGYYCSERDGNLTSIHSQRENDFIADLAANATIFGFGTNLWIGASSSEAHPLGFAWSDGTFWDYANWYFHEPRASFHCIQILSGLYEQYSPSASTGGGNGEWFSRPCTDLNAFVCKKPVDY